MTLASGIKVASNNDGLFSFATQRQSQLLSSSHNDYNPHEQVGIQLVFPLKSGPP
jgi:hypothetical protein